MEGVARLVQHETQAFLSRVKRSHVLSFRTFFPFEVARQTPVEVPSLQECPAMPTPADLLIRAEGFNFLTTSPNANP
jgi:hypothetical protein